MKNSVLCYSVKIRGETAWFKPMILSGMEQIPECEGSIQNQQFKIFKVER